MTDYISDYIPDAYAIEEEDTIEVCKFCGKAECNCCPNCGSPINKTGTEPMCDVCGWAQ